MLTIALLLCCFKSYCQTDKAISSFTGDIVINSDTTCVVPITLIKKANVKIIERNAFENIIIQQDSIILFQKRQVDEYSYVVTDMQKRISKGNEINSDLHKTIEKQKKRNNILLGTSIGAVAITLITLLVK